jgi:WD40 repeat protein/predicted Ser/Thr protein kinase
MMNAPLYCDSCGAANRAGALYCYACGQPLQKQGQGHQGGQSTGLLIYNHLLKQRYRILQQVGKGGFGAVYKAADMQFGNRLVAIKEMSQASLSPQEMVEATEAFRREAMLLANLTHPNLPRIYEQFTDMGRSYLVMDFIEGETLEDALAKLPGTRLPIDKTLEIATQLCGVLDYLHMRQPPIVFRDLKPANVMLAANGHVYLIDFGIARHFKPGQSKDTAALGSTGYAAPEQYGKAQSTPRADLYALGATLHQLLTGHDPSETPFQFAPLHLPGLPFLPRLQALLTQMLDMDAGKRPASAALIRQELQAMSTHLLVARTNPLQADAMNRVPIGYQPPASLPPTIRRKAAGASAKVPAPAPANMRFACNGHSSRITVVAWSPDGKHLASSSYDKSARIWDSTHGYREIVYRGHTDRVQAVAWSPDGKRVASASSDRTVQIWDAATGSPIFTYHGHGLPVMALAWSPDGTRIASGGDDKTVQVWDASNGTLLYTHRGHAGRVQAIVWSPDGTRIASGGDDKTVQVWMLVRPKSSFFSKLLSSTSSNSTYRGHAAKVYALAWAPNGQRIASVSADKTLQVWDALGSKKYFIYRSNGASLNAIAWSPDGRYIAAGGNDKMAHIWDGVTRQGVYTYHGHTNYVTAITWSPDGKLLASASVDRTIQVWEKR